MQWKGALCIALAGLGQPAMAAAGESDGSSANEPKLRLMGNMGVASAVGEMGGTFTYAPRPEVQLELGAGLGLTGTQFSLMPKLTAGGVQHRFVLGIGPSLGVGSNPNPAVTCESLWLNAEVGYEYRSASGISFLVAVGITKGIAGHIPGGAPGSYDEGDATAPEAVSGLPVVPQGRIAFGHWF